MTVRLRVLSSAPEYVSGGDARIEVRAAKGLHDKLELWLERPAPGRRRWNPAATASKA